MKAVLFVSAGLACVLICFIYSAAISWKKNRNVFYVLIVFTTLVLAATAYFVYFCFTHPIPH